MSEDWTVTLTDKGDHVVARLFDRGEQFISIGMPYRGRIDLDDEETAVEFRERAYELASQAFDAWWRPR